jgi:hypothetical protein
MTYYQVRGLSIALCTCAGKTQQFSTGDLGVDTPQFSPDAAETASFFRNI